MATEEEVAAGLIDWINSFDVKEPVQSARDLNDGEILWSILQQIDGFSFPGSLPEPPTPTSPRSPRSPSSTIDTTWLRKWNNLKHLYDALTLFLTEECGQQLPLFTGSSGGMVRPDLKSIAQHSSLPDLVLLLKLCVVAAINCADRIEFLTKMQELAESTQEVLMATAQEAGEVDETREGSDGEARRESVANDTFENSFGYPTSNSVGLEMDLATEERLGKVIADNQRIAMEKRELQNQVDDLHLRIGKMQQKNDRTQEELTITNDRLTAVLSGKVDGAQSKVVDQKSDAIIAALEMRLQVMDGELIELRKTNDLLRIKADKAQQFQDDLDEIKVERDKLSRKANTAEKYRQKLESIQDIEKENESLKNKVSELQTQIKQSDSTRASSSNLQREVDEYRRLLPSIEQERYDLNEMKKQLEFDYYSLEARYHDLNDQLTKSNRQIEDLQGRLRDYDDGVTPTTPTEMKHEAPQKHWEKEEADFLEAEARLTAALLESSSPAAVEVKEEGNDKEKEGEKGGDEEVENVISEDELRVIMSAMRAQAQAGTANEKETGLRTQKRLLIAYERERSKKMSLADHIKQQSETITQLKQEIDESAKASVNRSPPHPETNSTTPAQPLPDESQIQQIMNTNENLKREIRLMTSAWYEQNQRFASLNVGSGNVMMLMRGKMSGGGHGIEEPKSFLGKQRKLIKQSERSR